MDCAIAPSLEPPPPQPASNVTQASPTAVSWNLMVCLLIGIFLLLCLLKLLGTGCADDKKNWSLPRFAARTMVLVKDVWTGTASLSL
jgi:hypothetical protein